MDLFNIIINVLDSTIRLSVPLLLACLAGLYSERAGVFDIGLEGKMLAGAFAGAAAGAVTGSAWAGLATAILFGVLYQGGAELAFEMPAISRDMIVIIQGLVILFAGALEHMFRPTVQAVFASFSPRAVGMPAAKGEGV